MLLTRKKVLKTPKRTLKHIFVSPKNRGKQVLIAVCSVLIYVFFLPKTDIKSHVSDLLNDASVLALATIESPSKILFHYKKHLNRHRRLSQDAFLLERALADLKKTKNSLKAQVFENKELRNLLSLQNTLSPHEATHNMTVPCFGQHSGLEKSMLFLHAGHQQNLQRFDPVLFKGALVGQVDHIGGQTSRVLLITNPNSRIPVISEKSNGEGILTGDEYGNLKLDFTNKPESFIQGEAVFTSGVDGYLARGLMIGHVSYLENETVYIKASVNPKEATYVQIRHGVKENP